MNDSATSPIGLAAVSSPSLITRLLHLALASGVTLQLLLSTIMQRPRPGTVATTLESLAFSLHEVIGLSLALVIPCWLLWLLLRRDEPTAGELFMWTRRAGRLAMSGAIRRVLTDAWRGLLTVEGEIQPLVRSVHGLGILCVLLMACSGILAWLGMDETGALTGWARIALDIHQLTANFMWLFLIGHAGMALLHQYRGEATISRMFSLRKRAGNKPGPG